MQVFGKRGGFTLVELLVVIAIIGIISAVGIPSFNSYYSICCLKAAAVETAGMIKEGKQKALGENDYAVSFDPIGGRITLLAGRGPDGNWNTPDDLVVRFFRLADKGSGLSFGYGSCGPIPDHAATDDGISFQYNRLVCNEELTGNAGTVYFKSRSGAAVALVMNSTDFDYTLWKWDGSQWVKF